MKIYRFLLIAIVAATCCFSAQAQDELTPYSKMGYGMLKDNVSGAQRQMGGVGYAMRNGRQINAMNPASYSQVDSLTFIWDVGLDLTNLWSKEGAISSHAFGGGLDYISSMFRIYPHLGGSFGIVPYSSVGYSFGSILENGIESREGQGGITELYLGFGYEPFKNFSFGANFSYMFGTITNDTFILGSTTTLFERVFEIRDWNVHLGMQYGIDLTPRDKVILGFTYTPRKSFHGNRWGAYYDVDLDITADTVGYQSMKGDFEQPNSFGAGISYNRDNKISAEVDFTYQQWAKAKYRPLSGFEDDKMTFNNRWRVAAGLQFSPLKQTNYLTRMVYRVGAHYNRDYINVIGNNVRDYGISFGFGLPTSSITSKTMINIGFEWKHRISAPQLLIKEDYFNITLSVNFNELWFWKNKIR